MTPLPARLGRVVVFAGPSAAGKTVTGSAVFAQVIKDGWPARFEEGDDLLEDDWEEAMYNGQPFSDENRDEWIHRIMKEVDRRRRRYDVTFVTCSLLRKRHRDAMRERWSDLVTIYWLTASTDVRKERATIRFETGKHFFPPELVEAQEEALELPTKDEPNVVFIDAERRHRVTPAALIVEHVEAQLELASS